MKEVVTMVKGWVDDVAHLMISFVAIGAISEVLFGSGVFGVNVIGNLTGLINQFGESGFAGLVALLLLVVRCVSFSSCCVCELTLCFFS